MGVFWDSMEPPIAKIRERYQRMSDEDLVKLATEEARGLREDAQRVLLEEMANRQLSAEVFMGMQDQLADIDSETVWRSAEIIRTQPCPHCGSTDKKLNATLAATAIGMLVLYSYEVKFYIGCPHCLDKQHNRANMNTALLGWWGLPGAFFRPFMAFLLNVKKRKQNHQEAATIEMLLYAQQNLGKIRRHENNPTALRDILRYAFLK